MRFKYSTTSPLQDEFDSLPRLPLFLTLNNRSIQVTGLVDSGATVNVLPYEVGHQLFVDTSQEDNWIKLREMGQLGVRTANAIERRKP